MNQEKTLSCVTYIGKPKEFAFSILHFPQIKLLAIDLCVSLSLFFFFNFIGHFTKANSTTNNLHGTSRLMSVKFILSLDGSKRRACKMRVHDADDVCSKMMLDTPFIDKICC